MTGRCTLPGDAIPGYVPTIGDTEQAAIHRDYLGFLSDVAGQCGAIGQYHRGNSPVVLVNTPELVRALLIDGAADLTKGSLARSAFRALLGESLSMSEGDRHHRLRLLLVPLFSRRHVARYVSRTVRVADTICAGWADHADVDLFAELHQLTMHTLGHVLIAEPALWAETGQFWQARERLWQWINSLAGERRELADPATGTLDAQVAVAITAVQHAVDQIIHDRQYRLPRQDDLLADIVDANDRAAQRLDPAEIRDQVIALLFAAHETSAAALFWSLHLLAGRPTVLRRVEQELDCVLAGRLPELADLAALPYTLQVVKEAMRLYPPAARQFRVATRDTTLAGHPIAEGTPVSVCHYVFHRNPAAFPEPDGFAPERFAPDAPPRHPLSYLPFGAGERTCLGRHYAMQEIHLLLAMLISRFQLTFPEAVPPQLAVTLRPDTGVRVQLRHRPPHAPHGLPPSGTSRSQLRS